MSIQIKIPKYNLPVKKVLPEYICIEDLLPHEEIVTERLYSMKNLIRESKVVDMPIIVAPIPGLDKYLIVDGHHRWAALKELGAKKVPSIIIDYFSESVKVFTWYPGISKDYVRALREIQKLNVSLSGCFLEPEEIDDSVLDNKAFVLLTKEGGCYEIYGFIEGQKVVLKLIDRLNVEGIIDLIWYGLLKDALKGLRDEEVDLLFLRRALTKEEIMKIVKEGKVLPPKTTRHVLPYIPARINVPLKELL